MLKTGNKDEISDMFKRMQHECQLLMKSVIYLVYYMRGAIQYNDMLQRTFIERELIREFIDERFDQEKKNLHPVY